MAPPAASLRREVPVPLVDTSRMAANGATFPALRAGETAAAIVTPSPATSAVIAVADEKTTPPAGMSKPRAASMALRPPATKTPAASPSSDATRPTPSASRRTEPRTCRRLAPRARSRACSRVRWATVIENVLKIMNPPTSRAMMAKMSRKLLKNDMALLMALCVSAVIALPVRASVPLGSTAEMRLRISVWETPEVATTEMLSKRPGSATRRWAAPVVKSTNDAPPGESAVPNLTMPVRRAVIGPPFTRTGTLSPTR